MRKTAQLSVLGLPFHGLGLAGDRLSLGRGNGVAVRREHGQLVLVQMHHLVGVPHHGRHVGGREISVLSHPDDQGAPSSGNHDLAGPVAMNDGKPEGALHLEHGLAHGLAQIPLKVQGNQMGQHLRVRLGAEPDALLLQVLLNGMVVLDDPVVDHEHVLGHVAVRVGVLLGRLPVGGPPGVGDPAGPGKIQIFHLAFQLHDPSDRPVEIHTVSMLYGQTGRIVSAILEPLEPLDQNGLGLVLSHITNDAAHLRYILSLNGEK